MPRYTKISATLGLPSSAPFFFNPVPGNLSILFDLGITQTPPPFEEDYPHCQQFTEGLNLQVQVLDSANNPLNISAASKMEIKLLLPDGTTEDRTAVFFTDGSDGILQYQTLYGDLAQPGLYAIQAEIFMPSGIFPTSVGYFFVQRNVDNN